MRERERKKVEWEGRQRNSREGLAEGKNMVKMYCIKLSGKKCVHKELRN